MAPEFDVTVSVWNDFWAPELCEGLARGGFRVLALRSEYPPLAGVVSKTSETSRLLTRLFQRTKWSPLLEAAQDNFESFARRHTGRSRVFWGWNGHNLTAFESARRHGQRVICERGSTHAAWAARRINQVHRQLGWGTTDHEKRAREQHAIKEYSISDAILVPSGFVRDTFLQEGISKDKIFINAYGADLDHWSSVEGVKRATGPLVFVFTASMTPRKGVHVLLEAWRNAGLPDAELWMCGGVHFPIKKLDIPVNPNVRFLGYKNHAELLEIYERAAVYVLPSFEEGMARSGIEALAAGLPAIVTKETGLTDLMTTGKEGWIISSGDSNQLAETLKEVASNRHTLPEHSRAAKACTIGYSKKEYGDRAANFLRSFL